MPVVALLPGDSVHCQRKACDTAGRGVLRAKLGPPRRAVPSSAGTSPFQARRDGSGWRFSGRNLQAHPHPPFPTPRSAPSLPVLLADLAPLRTPPLGPWQRRGWSGRGNNRLPPPPPPPYPHPAPTSFRAFSAASRRWNGGDRRPSPHSSANSGCPRGQGSTPTQLCPQVAWQGSGCFLKLFFF